MKKLLCLLLLLPTLVFAQNQEVLDFYLCDRTLVVQTQDYPAYEYTVEYFLTLCPEADPATAVDITPRDAHGQYDMSASVFADASGAAWLKDGNRVYAMTSAPGQRITSVCPALASYDTESVMLFTRQDAEGTEVCEIDPETGKLRVLLTTEETIVLVWREPLYSYDPLTSFDYDLLCTAEITQPDPASPLLSYRLLEVAGDIALSGDQFVANLRPVRRYTIVRNAQAEIELAEFTDAFRQKYPDYILQSDSIVERADLLDSPDYGRLYEVRGNHTIWLWRYGEAHCLANGRLTDAALTDLTGDGQQELVYIYTTGSGVTCQNVAFWNPDWQRVTGIHETTDRYAADPPLSLSLTDEGCTLMQDGAEIGTVTQHGLDTGLSMIDFMTLETGVSTCGDVAAICPGLSCIVTSFGSQANLLLSDGTTLTLKFIGPAMLLSDMEHCWHELPLADDTEELTPLHLDEESEARLLSLIELNAAPENFVGLLSGVRMQQGMGETVALGLARTDSWMYLVWFMKTADGSTQTYKYEYPLNHDRTALESIQPGMTLEQVRAISPYESQYLFLYASWSGVPLNSVHYLPTGEALNVTYEAAENGYIVTDAAWWKP